jgi:hypothetical protein
MDQGEAGLPIWPSAATRHSNATRIPQSATVQDKINASSSPCGRHRRSLARYLGLIFGRTLGRINVVPLLPQVCRGSSSFAVTNGVWIFSVLVSICTLLSRQATLTFRFLAILASCMVGRMLRGRLGGLSPFRQAARLQKMRLPNKRYQSEKPIPLSSV